MVLSYLIKQISFARIRSDAVVKRIDAHRHGETTCCFTFSDLIIRVVTSDVDEGNLSSTDRACESGYHRLSRAGNFY
jgi:hypothetical protein